MVIGSSSFGLIGEFHFRVRSQMLTRTPFGNTYIFELSGGASVEARVFGITLAGVGLDFSFTAQGAGRTKIELSVTVRIHLLFVTIKKTARFTIGYLELPPLVYLAAAIGRRAHVVAADGGRSSSSTSATVASSATRNDRPMRRRAERGVPRRADRRRRAQRDDQGQRVRAAATRSPA